MSGLYLHIPFCRTRCIYCDFHSGTDQSLQKRYVQALCKECALRIEELHGEEIETVYLGGGTPSLLQPELLQSLVGRLSEWVDWNRCKEVTIECNPDDLSAAYLSFLQKLPVNRLSMGIQSFDDNDLQFLRRRHSAQAAIDAVKRCQASGFDNISIDLIYALPRQTPEAWEKNIETALSLGIQHISAYSLMYESGTALKALQEQGVVEECDEEVALSMYNTLIDKLEEAGYKQYEISNFALCGKESRHNSSYWQNKPYLGLGAAAHSYDRRCRRYNPSHTKAYIESIEAGKCCYEEECLSETDRFNDMVLTRLRTRSGIDQAEAEQAFAPALMHHLAKQSEAYIRQGLMEVTEGHLRITRRGIFISDTIIRDLFYV